MRYLNAEELLAISFVRSGLHTLTLGSVGRYGRRLVDGLNVTGECGRAEGGRADGVAGMSIWRYRNVEMRDGKRERVRVEVAKTLLLLPVWMRTDGVRKLVERMQ